MKKKAAFALIIIGIIFFYACLNPHKYLQKENSIECEYIGFKNTPSKSYPKYRLFRDRTSIEQLKFYTRHENTILKTYAFWALIERLEEGYVSIMDNALRDTSTVFQRCGCTTYQSKIADSAYMNFFETQLSDESVNKIATLKHDSQKLYQLDSLIITHPVIHEDLIEIALKTRRYDDPKIIVAIESLAVKHDLATAKEYLLTN